MFKYLSCLIFFLSICVTNAVAQSAVKGAHHVNVKTGNSVTHKLTYVIINSEQNTFGYDILDNNHAIIHQPSIPGMPGNKGFVKKEDAAKVAKLVIKKINKNIMPPAVTKQELEILHIKF